MNIFGILRLSGATGAIATVMLAGAVDAQTPTQASQPSTTGAASASSTTDAPPPLDPSGTAAAPATDGLGDIVVTAQRRAENLQKAALAITAVDSSALVRADVTDATQLTRVVPALQIGTIAGSANAFYLRGVGNFTTNTLSDAAVSFNIDGVAIARSLAAQAVFYDLERVEVLKGPQGTLYGRNSTGGAINVITAKPRIGEFSGYVNGEYGNFDAKKVTAVVNAPLGEQGAIRIAGYLSDHDGYYTDGSGDDRTRAIRIQMTTRPSDTFKLTVGADYAFQGGRGSGATVNGLDRDRRYGITSPQAAAIYQSTFSFLAGNVLHPLDNDFFNHDKYLGAYAQADADTPVGTLTILPAYRYAQVFQRSYTGSFAYNENLHDDQFSGEVRLAKDIGKLSYILGGYYLFERGDERPTYGQQYFAGYGKFNTNTNSYAAFGRLTFRVTDRFRLTGGARYTIDDKKANLLSYNLVVVCPAVFAGGSCRGTPALPNTFYTPSFVFAPNGSAIPVQPYGTSGAIVQDQVQNLSPSKTFRKFTYRAGAEYDLGPQSLLYASYETGFKSGGFFSSIDNPIYQPETISAITVGSKNRFFDNKVQLNVEGFYWNYKNQQISHFRLNSLAQTEFVTENVGKSRIWGGEVEARARVAHNTTVNATAQYLHAEFKDFRYANPAALGAPVTGCPYAPGAGGVFIVDCSGRRPPSAPKWSVTGGIEQVFDLSNLGRLIFNADARYQSSVYTGFELLARQLQKGYGMVDLQLTYEVPGSHITIAGFADNLTDKNVVGFSAPHPRAPSLIAESLRPPRTYGVRAGYKF